MSQERPVPEEGADSTTAASASLDSPVRPAEAHTGHTFSDVALPADYEGSVPAGPRGTAETPSFRDSDPMSEMFPPQKRRRGRPSRYLQELLAETPTPPAPTEPSAPMVASTALRQQSTSHGDSLPLVASSQGSNVTGPVAKADLTIPEVASFLPQRLRGFSMPSVNAAVLLQCSHAAAANTSTDETYTKIHEAYLSRQQFHLVSHSVRAQQLGLSRQGLHSKLARLMNAQCLLQRLKRTNLEELVAHTFSGQQLVAYVDSQSYDETPMKATIKDDHQQPQIASHQTSQLPSSSMAADESLLQRLDAGRVEGMKLKILQSRQSFGMLLKHGASYVHITGQSLCPLQVMERSTAEVLKESLLRQSAVSPRAAMFSFPVRLSCSDKAAYNLKAEAQMVSERAGPWRHLHTTCDVHATSTTYGKVFEGLVPSHVTGLIHCALSLRDPAALQIISQMFGRRGRAQASHPSRIPASRSTRTSCTDDAGLSIRGQQFHGAAVTVDPASQWGLAQQAGGGVLCASRAASR